MHLTQKILPLLLVAVFAISCNQNHNNSCGSAWVGGEIVNPKRPYVIMSQSRKIIDTIYLDKNNFFIYNMDQVEPGIYFFSHNEYQALYLQPNDSLMLRVNTMEFDESLSFTGRGSRRNNLMMELFLHNEEIESVMPSLYGETPEVFEQKIDSIKRVANSLYKDYQAKETASDGFDEIVTAAIDYGMYSKKEHYIAANSRKKVYNDDIDIPESFFSFRKKIDYGNEFLRSYYPYYRFLSFHLDNLAFAKYQQNELYNPDGFTHNYLKNKLIDSLITNETLKNRLLRTNAHRYFLNAKDEKKEHILLEQFKEFSSNDSDKSEIERLANATIKLTPGHTIPNLALLTTDNTVKDLHSIFNRPTVIYFWSNQSIKHYKKIHTRANELRDKYPEYDFIGINLDTHFKKWLKVIKTSGYRETSEFQFEDFDDAEMKLVINSVNKAMVVDEDGKILDGNTNIFDLAIESELLAYLNK